MGQHVMTGLTHKYEFVTGISNEFVTLLTGAFKLLLTHLVLRTEQVSNCSLYVPGLYPCFPWFLCGFSWLGFAFLT